MKAGSGMKAVPPSILPSLLGLKTRISIALLSANFQSTDVGRTTIVLASGQLMQMHVRNSCPALQGVSSEAGNPLPSFLYSIWHGKYKPHIDCSTFITPLSAKTPSSIYVI